MEEEKKDVEKNREQNATDEEPSIEKAPNEKPSEEKAEDEKPQDKKNEESWNYNERRAEMRAKISLKKTFPSEFLLDELKKTYVYISDISHGGMKIITELNLPEQRTFVVRLHLEAIVEFTVEVVWKRQLVGYMNSYGLKFVEITPESYKIIENFIAKYAIDTSKRIYRLNKMINLQIMKDEKWVTFYAYILNMSPHGLEYTTDHELPVNEEFQLRSYLIQGEQPIEASAKILFQKEISMGRTKGWLEFSKIDEKNKLRLTEHIDKLLQGEPPSRAYSTIHDFEIPDYEPRLTAAEKKKAKKESKKIQSKESKAKVKKLIEKTVEVEGENKSWVP